MKPQTISLGLKIIETKSSLIHQLVGLTLVVSMSTSHMVGRGFASRPGHALKRSPGINCKSRELYHGPGLLSSGTWPSLPIKHYNGLIVINKTNWSILTWWIFIPMVLSVYVYVSVYTYMSMNFRDLACRYLQIKTLSFFSHTQWVSVTLAIRLCPSSSSLSAWTF